nr:integrase, catalytic region, zinc finger, CCHC-type, peptidase aspartic, catalytic [Tanacetum cinerariifolium]
MKYQPKVVKPNKVGTLERLATPKPRKPRFLFRWLPTGRLFDQEGKLAASSNFESPYDCSNGNLKLLINFVWKFMGTIRFGNDHVAAILGFGDLQWGNILITRVYFIEGLGHNLFSVGQFCDIDLEVAFRRNACFVRNLKGVDLLKGDYSTNLYTINLYEMAFASPICLPKFKYHKEYLFPSCEQDEAPEVIIKFLKRVTVLLQSPVIIIRINNGTEFKNQVLKEFFDTVVISHQMSSVRTPQ